MIFLLLKTAVGVVCFLYGGLLLHEVAHEIDKEDFAKYVFIVKK